MTEYSDEIDKETTVLMKQAQPSGVDAVAYKGMLAASGMYPYYEKLVSNKGSTDDGA